MPHDADLVHVVIGASGGTGSALVRELCRRGRRVRAVNRSGRIDVPPGVDVVAADATVPGQMIAACRGAGVVYNAVNPPLDQWRPTFPAVVDAVLAGARSADARMVLVDNTWMYGRVAGPMTEGAAQRPVSSKGVLRAWLAERVLAAHARGWVRTSIGRAPELYGPGVTSFLGSTLFTPAVGRGPALWVGAMDQPLAPMYVDDLAFGLAELGQSDAALGRAWHIPTDVPTTARAFVHQLGRQADRQLKVLQVGSRGLALLGATWGPARHTAELVYQFHQPHVVDAGAYRQQFGSGQVTTYEQGIAHTLNWYRSKSSCRRPAGAHANRLALAESLR